MSLLLPQSGDIPLPQPGPISEPYCQGCREGVLRFQRCLDCSAPTHTPALMCAVCASRSLVWVDSSGNGEIYSWTRVWRPVTPDFVTPYVPVIVAMEEGWFILSNQHTRRLLPNTHMHTHTRSRTRAYTHKHTRT